MGQGTLAGDSRVCPRGNLNDTRGRTGATDKPRKLSTGARMSESNLYGAIDLGGTKVRALIAGLDGNERGFDLRPSETERGLESVLARMRETLEGAVRQAGVAATELRAVGIASPGAIDVHRGVVSEAPQLAGWRDVPLVRIMSDRLGLPVYIENDASAAALGEHRFGAGRGSRHMLYITVSTGIGGGIIIDGELYEGASGSAGELGHIVIDVDGPPCGCGSRGCLESLASGTAIGRRGREMVAAGEAPVLARLAGEDEVTAEHVKQAGDAGETSALELFREAGRYFGIALGGFVNIFNPEVIVVGGGVGRASKEFMEEARMMMQAVAMRQPLKHARLAVGALGDRAGLLGMIARLRREAI